ncbi:lrrc6, partial [Symbiodinium sp. KB8]
FRKNSRLPGLCSQASGIIFAQASGLIFPPVTALRFRKNSRLPGLCSQASGLIFAPVTALRQYFVYQSVSGQTSFHCLATELTESQRVAVAHVRIGPLHVRCIAVYGWPANHSDAAARNDALLCQVLKVVSDGGAPTIIGGDFNTLPQNLACWQQFQAMGYREVFQMWRERFQVHLPATCKGATRHDTVLLPPVLADLAISARVDDTCFDFDAHAPLMVTFKLPAQVEQAYAVVADRLDHRISVCSSRDELEHAFLEWAQALESAVDSAVRQQHSEDPVTFPTAGLPRNARGRCEYRVAKKKPLPAAAPQARHGDYNPPAEPLTVKARARTRQARRLRTFVSSLQAALHHDRVQVPTVNSQLANEWRAITKASGYGTGFPHWLLQCAHFHEFPALQHNKPFVPPDIEWVRDVCEYVRFDCDHIVKQEARHRAKLAAHVVHLDITDGHSTKGYAALRPQANPPFSAIPVQEAQTGRLIQAIDGTVGLYATSAPAAFRTDLPLDVAGVIATVLGVQESDQHGPLLRVSMPQAPLPSTAEFRQQTEASCASELNRAFTLFWHPIWTRDRGESLSDVEHWTQFCSNLPPAPANTLPDLDFQDMQLWRASLKQLRVRSATGYCGFSNAELRWLPDSPFRHLLHLYRLCVRWGFPSHMGRATVSVLAKVEVLGLYLCQDGVATMGAATLPAGTQLKVLQSAKDLGVHYRFRATTGNPQAEQRINEACRRLQQLQSLRRPLFNKAKLIQTSVWPAAFYGCEGRLLPVSTVARVRSCAARALVGPHSSASPYLALAALTTSVVDPEVYLLSAALCSLSRLLQVRPDVGAVWLQSTVQCQVDHCRAIGPATSLAMALRRNGWVLYANGVGKGPGHTVFDLCTGAAAKIRAAVRAAWGHELPTRVQHRNGMLQCPVPAPDIMHKCLLRFPDKVRLFLAQSTVGALLSDAAKATWDPLQDPTCQLCGGKDTKEHRLLTCPVTEAIRRPFQGLLEHVSSEQRYWLHCAYPSPHEDEPLLRLVWQSRRIPPAPSPVPALQHVESTTLQMFTDGSCSNPTCPAARHASWAVLLYTGPEPVDADLLLARWQGRTLSTIFFHVVAQGVVPGEQTIARAEFIALCQASQVALQRPQLEAQIWSDSSTALRAAQQVQVEGPATVPAFARDLLDSTADNLFPASHRLLKVKAHASPAEVPHADILPTLGNTFADEAAKAARQADLELVINTTEAVAEWRRQEADRLYMFFQYQLELAKRVKPLKAAVELPQGSTMSRPLEHADFIGRWGELSTGRAAAAWRAAPRGGSSPRDQVRDAWFQQLWWSEPTTSDQKFTGITFLELLVNFALVTRSLPARTIKDPLTKTQRTVELTSSEGILLPANLRDLLSAFVIMVQNMCKRCTWNILKFKHRKIRSL